MYRLGARTFLEVGPDAKLSGLVAAILEGRDHVALAVDASRGRSSNQYDLACASQPWRRSVMLSISRGGMTPSSRVGPSPGAKASP